MTICHSKWRRISHPSVARIRADPGMMASMKVVSLYLYQGRLQGTPVTCLSLKSVNQYTLTAALSLLTFPFLVSSWAQSLRTVCTPASAGSASTDDAPAIRADITQCSNGGQIKASDYLNYWNGKRYMIQLNGVNETVLLAIANLTVMARPPTMDLRLTAALQDRCL
ncbi:glycoside hydrolase family 28 protein [Zopfia rhizophila CBS 207.26]|uniref:Glycoside hydrolase family 28 protein n=1 Tax=Zopfia rhizophila CBS 207.26 TaxID=1314779 RepID=A0A6A6D4Y4_9PEZI|nr:glycoside hydrolase family 28 protein [Zopfia rhizophila CBS 207.26]KAF2174494.1 glycoside hydrolase family 28 protein [Zopfia rhizophila CBS 207.26]